MRIAALREMPQADCYVVMVPSRLPAFVRDRAEDVALTTVVSVGVGSCSAWSSSNEADIHFVGQSTLSTVFRIFEFAVIFSRCLPWYLLFNFKWLIFFFSQNQKNLQFAMIFSGGCLLLDHMTSKNSTIYESAQNFRNEIANQTKSTVTPAEAAEILGVNPHTLAVWRSTSRYALPYIKIGRKIRYRISDLENWMAKRTRLHTGQTTKES